MVRLNSETGRSQARALNGRMITELERMLKEAFVAYLLVPSWHSSGGIDKNQKTDKLFLRNNIRF
jgi:hypothetical protein